MIVFMTLSPIIYADSPDPTRPTNYMGEENSSPGELTAVFVSAKRRIAIIGEISVKVGDDVSGEKVVAIEPDSVTLEGINGKRVLYLTNKNLKHISD